MMSFGYINNIAGHYSAIRSDYVGRVTGNPEVVSATREQLALSVIGRIEHPEVLTRIADHPITCIGEPLPWNIRIPAMGLQKS